MQKFFKAAIFLLCSQQMAQHAFAQKAVSNSQYSSPAKTVKVYTTAKDTKFRLSETDQLKFTPKGQPFENEACVFVDPSKTFQSFIGIGAALTDASAETFYKLPKDKQKQLLQDFYDPQKGIGYTLARTTIQSCDFSSGSYSYVQEGDAALKTFSIAHDKKYRIPFIKEAINAAGGKLTTYVSPWSPPAFMKDNNNMLQGGKLKPEFYQPWANMYIKFINAYEKEGIPVWGLSVQNEPMAKQKWESCMYTAEEERDFVKNYLGPTLHKAGMASKKLIVWDHNRDLIYQRASTMYDDPEAAKYVWGTGFHWYVHDVFDNIKRVKEAYPDKNLIFTEGCSERYSQEKINDWQWGEVYGRSMVNDFNNGITAWTDWNIFLDQTGGPNHVGNFCYAPVHADTNSGQITYMNSYYYIGHFSKFLKPGAKRIISSSNRDKLQTTAFVTPDKKLVIVVLNVSNDTLPYNLWIAGNAAKTTSLPHSITTLVVQ